MNKRLAFLFAVSVLIVRCQSEDDSRKQANLDYSIEEDGEVITSSAIRGLVDLNVAAPIEGEWVLKMDGELIYEETARQISYSLNTHDFEDGEHELTISYENPDVRKTNKTVKLTIDNIMYTYQIASGSDDNFWIVLSNEDGVVYDYQSMKGKVRLDFGYPGDTLVESFNSTVVRETDTYTDIQTHWGKTPGVENFDGPSFPVFGQHIIEVPNRSDYDIFEVGSNYLFMSHSSEEPLTLQMRRETSPLFVLMKKKNEENVSYYFKSEVKPGQKTLIDNTLVSTKTLPATRYEFNLPEGSKKRSVSVSGFLSDTVALGWSGVIEGEGGPGFYYPANKESRRLKNIGCIRSTKILSKGIKRYLLFSIKNLNRFPILVWKDMIQELKRTRLAMKKCILSCRINQILFTRWRTIRTTLAERVYNGLFTPVLVKKEH